VATGKKFLGKFPTHQGTVLFIEGEDSPSLLQSRLDRVIRSRAKKYWPGGYFEKTHEGIKYRQPLELPLYVSSSSEYVFDTEIGMRAFCGVLDEVQPKLVIIDTLSIFAGALDLNDLTSMYSILTPLKKICRHTNCAILLVHHTRKQQPNGKGMVDENMSMANMYGSVALHAWADNTLYIGQEAVGGSHMLSSENKFSSNTRYIVSMFDEGDNWSPEVTVIDA